MDDDKQVIEEQKEFIKTEAVKPDSTSNVGISKPDINSELVKDLFGERKTQRKPLFVFSLFLVTSSFFFVVGVVVFQMYSKVYLSVDPLESGELEIITSGVFVQILGLLYIITNALWNDKDYLDYLKGI